MSRTEIEAKSLHFTLATCGAEVCFWPILLKKLAVARDDIR
jgi:hypothetical protein